MRFGYPGQTEPAGPVDPPAARFLTDADRAVILLRLPVCQSCGMFKGSTTMTVACGQCGCAGLSLISGSCPSGLWPKP